MLFANENPRIGDSIQTKITEPFVTHSVLNIYLWHPSPWVWSGKCLSNKQLRLRCVKCTIFIHRSLVFPHPFAAISLFGCDSHKKQSKALTMTVFWRKLHSSSSSAVPPRLARFFLYQLFPVLLLYWSQTGLSCLITYLKTARRNNVELTLHVISDGLVDVEIKALCCRTLCSRVFPMVSCHRMQI